MNERFNRLLKEVKMEMDKLGIPYAKYINTIEVNTRAKRRWGLCKRTSGVFSISLSSELNKTNSKAIKNVIAHELIHTVNGCFNHGANFKRIANIMNKTYGYNISRTTSATELGFSEEYHKEVVMNSKYVVTCQNCGTVSRYQRMCKTLQVLDRCTCGKCHSSNLKLTQNY